MCATLAGAQSIQTVKIFCYVGNIARSATARVARRNFSKTKRFTNLAQLSSQFCISFGRGHRRNTI